MKFNNHTARDENVRMLVASVLHEHINDHAVDHVEVEVLRTVDRKGHRHERDFCGPTTNYNGQPRTLIRVEVELDERMFSDTDELVCAVIAAEQDALNAEIAEAEAAATRALQRVEELRKRRAVEVTNG
ncbi:hypothetical protein SEA_ROSCOE_83 [Mycobacterium phage Roscoe]|nr:hypothetical protein M046_gp81 [Mycobacterium phage Newman]YP_009191176.1 hypothetical protein AU108_gp82 [Mycobacterium phage Eremos]AHY84350.1 hypothetical protein PBI_KINGVEVEVE_81 [Mycobacterium phage KingVeVeVe]ATN88791.1 hypothetical protein SEA_DINGO_80 [Mycobacterium phage Dingo]ATN89324.1 hypothetical protein SEA_HORCHATA_80 [Mycobacterium phage Horchata]ATN91019.1 hypothetical protein SEA_MIKOTA_80 [Mycobacterium phage Mikota]ATN91828.1 hypothetical protein SEA_SHEILA_79 [Mycobac